MKTNKKRTIVLIFLIGLLSSGILSLIMQNARQIIGVKSLDDLKTNDSSISIISPENKSYSEPMHGYFPSTYGFDNEQTGDSGTDLDFIDIDFSNGTSGIHVVDELDGHKKVIHCENSESGWWGLSHIVDNPFSTGTVEFYWKTMSQDIGSWIFTFADIELDWGIIIYQNMLDEGDLWCFGPGDTYYDLNFRPIYGIWYHFRISIDTTSDTWAISIDGMSLGTNLPFRDTEVDDVYYIHMRSWNLDTPAHFYYDAFGITGQSDNYQIGDNLYEGLFIEYQTTFEQEWAAYSLDGSSNTTIYGNHTIPMPTLGTHSLQIFANDSLGNFYHSDIRFFKVCLNDGWIPRFDKTAGDSPQTVFVGDVNNDGYNDIVIANYRSDDVSIYLWNFTLGSWDAQIRKLVGDYPLGLFVGDVNNDGYYDIITANGGSDDVSIFLWNSTSGDWNTQIRKSVGNTPWCVFIGDANNDGYNDIVTANYASDDISILLWNSVLEDWDTQIRKSVGKYPRSVFVGDANNDGYNDIVTTNTDSDLGDDDISILLWNPALEDWLIEIRKSVGDDPWCVFIEDANNDGYNDIVTANYASDDISIILWNSLLEDWDTQIRNSVENNPWYVFIGDANNDGYKDIVTANGGSDDISIILWNFTSGDWDAQIKKSVGDIPTSVFIGDANNDGYNDILVTNIQDDDISVILWDAPPSIIIKQPLNYQLCGDIAPNFDIRVKDYNPDSFWYTLDNGITNISISQFNDAIDQLEWDKLENGTVILRFYANDTNEQVGYSFVIIGKNVWSPPNPPLNVSYYSGYYNITLFWDQPGESAPVSHYNIYRGEIFGGGKIYIGSTSATNYTDLTVEFNKDYYYIIKAENIQGESSASQEIYAIAGPYIRWQAPNENSRVTLPVGDAQFDFSYDYTFLDDVQLFLNGIKYDNVKDKDSTILNPYNSSIDGPVNAVLYGYEMGNSNPIVNDSRAFIFAKLDAEAYEILDQDQTYLGEKLYLILHDPNGDNSYTWYEESSIVSMAVGLEITSEYSTGSTFGEILSDPLIGTTFGATYNIVNEKTSEEGFDYRYEIVDTTQLQSSIDDSDKNFIGPGYGDRYWGEAWTLKWAVKAYYRAYFNGTEKYEDPEFHYGIIRGQEVFLNDYSAPQKWKAQNPIHNGWQGVSWLDSYKNFTIDGGAPFVNKYQITSSETTSTSLEITHSEEWLVKVPGWEYKTTLNLNTKWYAETEVTESYEVGFTIYDDESTDKIVQDIGIDSRFGTLIFRTNEFMCETSYPLEHNTFDYLPPIIEFPHIELDSSQDGLAPCKDDSPIVTVGLFDEGGISSAYIRYSINNGISWRNTILSEQIANPGTWQGIIPAHDHGTTVIWYIKVWDFEGTYSNRTDPNGNPYRYTVINRQPVVNILNPNGGENFQDIVNIEWAGSDPDDDSLTYSLAYNLDNTGWHLIISGVNSTSFNWSVSDITSKNVLLKIIVNDGDMQNDVAMDYVFAINPTEISKQLDIEILDQLFSKEHFNITFYVYDETNYNLDFVIIKLWWDGTEVSADVQNLGNGFYFISLEPITVTPGEEPILLSITVTADGYEDKHIETYLVVDPDMLEKGFEQNGDEFPFLILTVALVSTAGASGAIIITLGILRKRKRVSEVI
ncbi:MAG: VCBS repeat-containing protein [Candidatus Lokiarchaeota archaeon]|nr:VCBS repeat-containing protein [Candidatus Lokiarchaeota archaeon]